MKAWHIALLVAYGIACLVGAFAYSQYSSARLAEREAEELKEALSARDREILKMQAFLEKSDAAIKRANEAVKAATEAHNERVETLRKTADSGTRDWLNSPLPDGVRNLFCTAGGEDYNAAGGALNALCEADVVQLENE